MQAAIDLTTQVMEREIKVVDAILSTILTTSILNASLPHLFSGRLVSSFIFDGKQ